MDSKEFLLRAASHNAGGMYTQMANSHPKLSRGQVWCKKCGRTQKVDSATSLRYGWPKCCGETMTIDAPDEQD